MLDFTIVIATTIRDSLPELLDSINKSSFLPKTVIISIPLRKKFYKYEKNYLFELISISEGNGQVSQRISGFKKVTTPLCIQMDDDLTFEETFLEKLIKTYIGLPQNSALAPSLLCEKNPISVLVSPKPPLSSFLYFILDSKINPKYGGITKSGIPLGINPYYKSNEDPIVKTEWLTGACVIHRTNQLITKWEYPYKGKAFAEDLMHSQLLKRNNIKLYVNRSLKVNLEPVKDKLIDKIIYYFYSRNATYRTFKNIPDLETSFIRYYLFSTTYIFFKILFTLFNFIQKIF